MASVSRALSRIKDDLASCLSEDDIRRACDAHNYTWRERIFGPVFTIQVFVLQILHLNVAITGLRHLVKGPLNRAAYCQARMRLPVEVLRALLRMSADAINHLHGAAAAGDAALWRGHRVLLLDGSSSIAPDTPSSRKAFGTLKNQRKGCGFPVAKIIGMIDGVTGVMLEMLCFPLYTHEASKTWKLHPRMNAGDLAVADRGFCSFVQLALFQAVGVLALFRMHQRQIVDFRPHRRHRKPGSTGKRDKGRPTSKWVRRLGKHDQLVDWVKQNRPKWMSKAQFESMPETVRVREIRYQLACKGQRTTEVTIATTLLDPVLHPKEAIAELYGLRWSVETHFGELKTTLKMRKVKCQTPAGVEKELIVYCVVYNLVRSVMLAAARRQEVEIDRISFIDTLRWLQTAEVDEPLADLVVNPKRPDRHEPRVIKDRIDTYPKMKQPRAKLRQALKRRTVASTRAK